MAETPDKASDFSQLVPFDELVGDLIGRGDPRFGIVWINPERMIGTPCFFGTRVPVKALFDYLEAGARTGWCAVAVRW